MVHVSGLTFNERVAVYMRGAHSTQSAVAQVEYEDWLAHYNAQKAKSSEGRSTSGSSSGATKVPNSKA